MLTHLKQCAICLLGLLAIFISAASGEDTVSLSSRGGRQATSRLRGEIVDYTGRQLVLRLSNGREIKRPAQQVVDIDTEWPEGKAEGDRFFDDQQFQQARDRYATAVRKETRAWARRALMARIIACYRELKQIDAAGKLFLALAREDPDTPYFAEIPLAWMSGEASATLEQTAGQWLADENPLAGLLGASHLLATLERQRALDRLSALALEKDARIACLAEAQIWRATVPTATEDRLAAWERRVETFPEALRAGPYWALGRALAQHGQAERAALAFLHLPVVYPQTRSLAADALHTAAQLVEKLGDAAAALRLKQELAARYPETAQGAEAKATLAAPPPSASSFASPAEADGLEATFLAGLRGRRLFVLAEHRCRLRLTESELSESARVDLAVELSRTLTEQALHETQAERQRLWSAAMSAAQETGGAPIKGSRRLLLDAQLGLVRLAHGELSRQEVELAGGNADSFDEARQELRAAVGLLQTTAKDAAAELRRATPTGRADADDLNANELALLQRHIEYQLARSFRNQGQTYPPRSPDRTNSLRQAVQLLETLAAGEPPDAVAWQARLDEIVCLRLLEEFAAAAGRLSKLGGQSPPLAVAAAARAEEIRLALDRRQLEDALAAADKTPASEDATSAADLDYARLEAYVAAWRAATTAEQTADAAQWQERAAATIDEIDQRYGRYWSRRAEMLLAGSVAGGGTQNLALLVRAAEGLYRSGQFDQALAAYDRAIRQAAETKQYAAAFDYAYTAAAIEQRRERYQDAARRFRAAALSDKANAKAGEAHLLAIYNQALAAKQGAGEASSRAYLDLLTEHLDRWPRGESAPQARLWLGGIHEREAQWSDAIGVYQGVPSDNPLAAAAVQAVSRCYQRWLSALAAEGEPTDEVAAAAAAYFKRLATNSRGALPERWSQVERIAATSVAAIWLQYADDQFAAAERLLSAALADAGNADEAWKSAAQTWQIFAVAAQGRREEAAKLLDQLSGGSPEQMLALIGGLQRVAEKAAPAVGRELAELQLQAAKRLKERLKELPPDEQRDFQRAYVKALAAAKRHGEAVKAAQLLADAFPRDGEIQEEYARLLVESSDRGSWRAAAAKWRDIGQKTRQGSERWLRAMYYRALALDRLGEREQAARLVKFTEGLAPELGGPELKAKFHELLTRRRGGQSRPSK